MNWSELVRFLDIFPYFKQKSLQKEKKSMKYIALETRIRTCFYATGKKSSPDSESKTFFSTVNFHFCSLKNHLIFEFLHCCPRRS